MKSEEGSSAHTFWRFVLALTLQFIDVYPRNEVAGAITLLTLQKIFLISGTQRIDMHHDHPFETSSI